MKNTLLRFRVCFICMLCAFGLSALSVLSIPVIDGLDEDYQGIAALIIACVFWGGMLIGCLMVVYSHFSFRRMRDEAASVDKTIISKRPGLLRVTNRTPYVVLYVIIVCGMIVLILDLLNKFLSVYLFYCFISITFFSFIIHCLVDGNNHRSYQLIKEGVRYGFKKGHKIEEKDQ